MPSLQYPQIARYFFIFSTITFATYKLAYCDYRTYFDDSLVVQKIIDINGFKNISVSQLSDSLGGRITSIDFTVVYLSSVLQPPLDTLPPEIGYLDSLKILRIVSNNLMPHREFSIPTEIGNLSALKELRIVLSDSGVNLPSKIWDLKSLEILCLMGIKIDSIPPEIANLTSLRHLNLSHDNILFLPKGIVNLKPDTVILDSNKLCEIDNEIAIWCDAYSPGWRSTQKCNPSSLVKLDLNTNNPIPAEISWSSFTEFLSIRYSKSQNISVSIMIFDYLGKSVDVLSTMHGKYSHYMRLNFSRYGKGNYIIVLKLGNVTIVKKFYKR